MVPYKSDFSLLTFIFWCFYLENKQLLQTFFFFYIYMIVLATAAAFVEAEGQRHPDTCAVSNCNFQTPLIELASYVHIFSLVPHSARPLSWIGKTNCVNDIGFACLLQACSPAQITEGRLVSSLSPRGAAAFSALHRSGCHSSQASQVGL